jgi:tripartite-type tricarboxylate transporter receptor subunit TctC
VLPAGAPTAIVERLNRDVVAIVNSPEGREALDKQGVVTDPGTPDALAKRIREDVVKWRDLIVSAGIGAQ